MIASDISNGLLARIEELLARAPDSDSAAGVASTVEAAHGAIRIASMLHGAGSDYERRLMELLSRASSAGSPNGVHVQYARHVAPAVHGVLRALRSDIQNHMVESLEQRYSGAVLGEMLGLAKKALDTKAAGTVNVAAVLTAAAYEDAIRRLGVLRGAVSGRPDLGQVLQSLKKAGILVGAPFTTAQGYLKFRNDALHADWENLDRGVVASCIVFVEHLLLQHFS